MTSYYHWEGKIGTGSEIIIIFKTRADLFPALEKRVLEIHHYDIPCIVALPLVDGHKPYLQWIIDETCP